MKSAFPNSVPRARGAVEAGGGRSLSTPWPRARHAQLPTHTAPGAQVHRRQHSTHRPLALAPLGAPPQEASQCALEPDRSRSSPASPIAWFAVRAVMVRLRGVRPRLGGGRRAADDRVQHGARCVLHRPAHCLTTKPTTHHSLQGEDASRVRSCHIARPAHSQAGGVACRTSPIPVVFALSGHARPAQTSQTGRHTP